MDKTIFDLFKAGEEVELTDGSNSFFVYVSSESEYESEIINSTLDTIFSDSMNEYDKNMRDKQRESLLFLKTEELKEFYVASNLGSSSARTLIDEFGSIDVLDKPVDTLTEEDKVLKTRIEERKKSIEESEKVRILKEIETITKDELASKILDIYKLLYGFRRKEDSIKYVKILYLTKNKEDHSKQVFKNIDEVKSCHKNIITKLSDAIKRISDFTTEEIKK